MASKVYSFVEQLERGAEGEKVLDEYFKQWYDIREATLDQQKDWKIDRIFKRNGQEWMIEYKTDDKTDKTGNLYIETDSAVEFGRPGWAWTTRADKIIYYALPDVVYIMDVDILREKLMVWHKEMRPKAKTKNIGYTTLGYLIPTQEIEEWAKKLIMD